VQIYRIKNGKGCNFFLSVPLQLKTNSQSKHKYMKKLLLSAFLICSTVLLFAQKVINDPNAEVRSVSGFHAIHVSNSFDVYITQGNEEALAVSSNHKEDMDKIITKVENGVLKIWLDEKMRWGLKNRKLKAYISVKQLSEIRGSGATDFNIEGELKAENLKLNLSGASDLKGKLTVTGKLQTSISGASDINISGSAEELVVSASGASDVKAYDFTTNTCQVDASGASGVKITVNKEMSARLSGASSVSYKGTAMIKDIKTSGASSISRKS
jgi:hypothetical protein